MLGGRVGRRQLQGQGRPVGLSVRRASGKAQRGTGRSASPPGSRTSPSPTCRPARMASLAVAGLRPASPGELVFDRTSMEIRNAQRPALGRGSRTGARRHPRPDARAGAADRRPGARPAGRPAALRQQHAGRRAWTGDALRRPARPAPAELNLALELPLAALDRSTREGQRRAGRQRRAPARRTRRCSGPRRPASTSRERACRWPAAVRACWAATCASTAARRPTAPCASAARASAQRRGAAALPRAGRVARLAGASQRPGALPPALGFVRRPIGVQLTSTSTGLAHDLPAPLSKPADAAWPLRIETRAAADGAPARRRCASSSAAWCRRTSCATCRAATPRGAARRRGRGRARRRCRRPGCTPTSACRRVDADAWGDVLAALRWRGRVPRRRSAAGVRRELPAARHRLARASSRPAAAASRGVVAGVSA